jgi:hypothetical protein
MIKVALIRARRRSYSCRTRFGRVADVAGARVVATVRFLKSSRSSTLWGVVRALLLQIQKDEPCRGCLGRAAPLPSIRGVLVNLGT